MSKIININERQKAKHRQSEDEIIDFLCNHPDPAVQERWRQEARETLRKYAGRPLSLRISLPEDLPRDVILQIREMNRESGDAFLGGARAMVHDMLRELIVLQGAKAGLEADIERLELDDVPTPLPCPACGNPPEIVERRAWHVACQPCGLWGEGGHGKNGGKAYAVEHWNTYIAAPQQR